MKSKGISNCENQISDLDNIICDMSKGIYITEILVVETL